jgi:hypothetical protein
VNTPLEIALAKRYNLVDASRVRLMAFKSDVTTEDDTIEATISTTTVDDDDEVLLASGADLSWFQKAGSVCWNHNHDTPIGVPLWAKRVGNSIVSKGRYLPKPFGWEGPWLPDYVKAFVKEAHNAGLQVGTSVGAYVTEYRRPTTKDRETFGDSVTNVVSKWTLYEWSLAPFPCNREALTHIVKAAHLPDSSIDWLLATSAIQAPQPKRRVSIIITPAQEKATADPNSRLALQGSQCKLETTVAHAVRKAVGLLN